MRLRPDIISFLFLISLAYLAIGEDCSFRKEPEKLVFVSNTATTEVKIGRYFELNVFGDFCLLKVKLPGENVVTFNITKQLEGDRYFGDKLEDQIWVDKNREYVYFKNTTEEFGPRHGYYYINGFEILGMYYGSNTGYKPVDKSDVHIQNCGKDEEKVALIKIDAITKNDPRIDLCIKHNERKNSSRPMGDYLFFQGSSANLTVLDRTSISFPADNLPFKIVCKIDAMDKNKDNGVKYTNTIAANDALCPKSSSGHVYIYIAVALCLFGLVGGCILYKYKKTKRSGNLGIHFMKTNKIPEWAKSVEFDRGHLEILKNEPLGKGQFGVVYKAVAQQFEERIGNVEVAVKTYPPESIQGHDDLYQEAEVLCGLEYHPSIINLLGISLDTVEFHHRLLLIIELCSKGSLLDFLREKDEAFVLKTETWTEDFNPEIMTFWSFQISGGMKYLSSKKIIHGDLAARNILLDAFDNIKITDFGKARQVNYDTLAVNVDGIQPLAWMAIEAVQKQQITLKSDIWSFGVTLWEIFSFGHHPYADKKFQEAFEWLRQGNRLPSPSNCPSQIYQVMMDTWDVDPKQRPPFSKLTERLKSMVDNKYLEKYWRIQDKQRKVYDSIRNYSADKKDKPQSVV